MMVYKYYDSLTKEDLEFSVGSKQNVWEVKEPLMAVSRIIRFNAKQADI